MGSLFNGKFRFNPPFTLHKEKGSLWSIQEKNIVVARSLAGDCPAEHVQNAKKKAVRKKFRTASRRKGLMGP